MVCPHPDGADGADAVGEVAGLVILRLGAAFLGGQEQPVEGGANERFEAATGQQVAGDLFACEGVEGLVPVERLDDVVAVRPDVPGIVRVIADGVGEPGDIEPLDRHAFAVMGRGQQAVDEAFVGVRGGILFEGGDVGGAGWKPDEIEMKTAGEGAAIGFGGGLDAEAAEAAAHEFIDGRRAGRG